MWVYHADVLKVLDANTLELRFDLGFGITTKERVKLYGSRAPEMSGIGRGTPTYQKAQRALSFVEAWITRHSHTVPGLGSRVVVTEVVDMKLTLPRFNVYLYPYDPSPPPQLIQTFSLNIAMIRERHAQGL